MADYNYLDTLERRAGMSDVNNTYYYRDDYSNEMIHVSDAFGHNIALPYELIQDLYQTVRYNDTKEYLMEHLDGYDIPFESETLSRMASEYEEKYDAEAQANEDFDGSTWRSDLFEEHADELEQYKTEERE